MPELPEVETVKRGIAPVLVDNCITQVVIHNHNLRWPIPQDLPQIITTQHIKQLFRRSKYLIIELEHGGLIIHLGMSGRIRIVSEDAPLQKHDHVEIALSNQKLIRYNDPRRFGTILWAEQPLQHKLLAQLGVEPLTDALDGHYLWQQAQRHRIAVKSFLMKSQVVVGIGNIYAAEALFASGIDPRRAANKINLAGYQNLVKQIKKVLQAAIAAGGTTLKDFLNGDNKPGYFSQQLNVYGREEEPCFNCQHPIQKIKQAQRSTYYCPHCQS